MFRSGYIYIYIYIYIHTHTHTYMYILIINQTIELLYLNRNIIIIAMVTEKKTLLKS